MCLEPCTFPGAQTCGLLVGQPADRLSGVRRVTAERTDKPLEGSGEFLEITTRRRRGSLLRQRQLATRHLQKVTQGRARRSRLIASKEVVKLVGIECTVPAGLAVLGLDRLARQEVEAVGYCLAQCRQPRGDTGGAVLILPCV